MGLVAHALIGYLPFPFGDDFVYAVMAQHNADPALFPRDEQLRMFANHAHVYEWLFALGQRGHGVEPVFRVALWLQAILGIVAVMVMLIRLGAPAAALPVVIGLGVVVQTDGLGRGDVGGLIAMFFHHHNVALSLILAAAAASLSRRAGLAGVFLGLAAYAQPMTAAHGALMLGLATLFSQPRDLLKLIGLSVLVAVPAALLVLTQLPEPSTVSDIDLITEAYRFRAPHHYDPSWSTLGITTLYLMILTAGAALFLRLDAFAARFGAGAVLGLALLHLVSVVVYKFGLGEWIPFFILDANRSSSFIFVLAPVFALAAIWQRGLDRLSLAVTAGLALAAVLNGTLAGLALVGFGALLVVLERQSWGARLSPVAALLALVLVFPPTPRPPATPEPVREILEQIRADTPEDALFVIPIGLDAFRFYAQRSAYVDFKFFSVAQPDQAALTRRRIDQLVTPAPEHRDLTGWPAVLRWGEDQRDQASCPRMRELLSETGADYILRMGDPDVPRPVCPGLPVQMENDILVLYGPAE